MEKICGFLDKENNFHKTEEECEKSNLKINIQQIEKSLDRFSNLMQEYIFRHNSYRSNLDLEYSHYEYAIKEIIAKCVLLYSDEFIKIINKKKEMEKTLDLLRQEKDYQNKWWMKIVWWK